METLTDQELIAALQQRLDFNRRALHDLQGVTGQLEATNRRLQESEALKSHFLSNIRNEINNPLASIIGLARQLAAGVGGREMTASIAQMIHAEAFHLDFQLQNIFIAAELEAGEAAPEGARVEVAGLVAGALEALRHQAEQKSIAVECIGPDRLSFVTDAAKLQLMVSNLLANALEFTPAGGRVTVEFGLDEGCLRISVRDSGPGIDPEDQELVFDRFRQLDFGSTKSHRGHGLGLSLVRALAQLLDGAVLLESSPGAGSSFTLVLPPTAAASDIAATDGNLFLFDQAEEF